MNYLKLLGLSNNFKVFQTLETYFALSSFPNITIYYPTVFWT